MTDFNYNILIISGAIIEFAAIIVGLILLYKIGQVRDKTKLTIFAIVCFFFYYMAIINPFVLRLFN